MRWITHLMGAAFAGIVSVILWEQFSGVSISQESVGIFAKLDIGPGLMIAILVLVALLVWTKSSRG